MMLARMIGQAEARAADCRPCAPSPRRRARRARGGRWRGSGSSDEAAGKDMAELRELLRAWRDAKRSAWKAAVGWVVRMVLALVLVGLAVKLGFGAWVK